ncbi:MAG: glycerol uptake facilitator protein [Actinomycetota bacterium]|jgi:glycerol uptake facilitator protein|nr:glycerol uptake facilitator protein [Actinomycetota bacterium]
MADAYDSARIETAIARGEQTDDLDATGEAPLLRRLAAEFFGTLIFVAVGTGAATALLLGPLQRFGALAGLPGMDVPEQQKLFGALVGTGASTISEILPVAFAFAAVLTVLVYAVGGVSGAHFNPAVTFSLAVVRRFRWKEVPGYWIAQCLGAIAGSFVIAGIYGQNGANFFASGSTAAKGTDILFGATRVASGIKEPQAILAEALIAFILVTAIMAVAVDHRAPKGWSGWVIGLGLAGGILVTATATGGSANFARSLGPFVASLLYDTKNIPWSDLLVYAAGPLIGGSAAALVYESVTGLERVAPEPQPGAATADPYEPPRGGTVV